jgi:hypothetical protein
LWPRAACLWPVALRSAFGLRTSISLWLLAYGIPSVILWHPAAANPIINDHILYISIEKLAHASERGVAAVTLRVASAMAGGMYGLSARPGLPQMIFLFGRVTFGVSGRR